MDTITCPENQVATREQFQIISGINYVYFWNYEKIGLGSTAESSYHICGKDGTYSSVTEIGVATNFDQFSTDYYSYKVICDCAQETDSYSGGTQRTVR